MSKVLSEKIKKTPIYVWAFLCPIIGIIYFMIYPFYNYTELKKGETRQMISPRKVLVSAGYGALLVLLLEYVLPRMIMVICRLSTIMKNHQINYVILMIVIITVLLAADHVLRKRGDRKDSEKN